MIGKNLYLVIQKALEMEIKNKVASEANESPALLKKNSIITKKINDGTSSFIYFLIFTILNTN